MKAKRTILHISKWLGLFRLARYLGRPGVRILCYHGFALADEAEFRPKLFIRPETFEARLRFIAKQNFLVLFLGDAVELLSQGQLPSRALVITIDDGFCSVLRAAVPLLRTYSLPATVYVTTYYCLKQTPVFRLAMQYMFWKTKLKQLDFAGLRTPFNSLVSWRDDETRDRLMWDLIRFGETQLSEEQRITLTSRIGKRLEVDYESIVHQRKLSLMNLEELRELASFGIDVQLHTHRHQLPEDDGLIRREISQNREVLEPILGKRLEHLCYPSGVWSRGMWEALQNLGIRSATTCEPGLNRTDTPRLGLKRFLDGENISQIEFEAEVSGFNDLLRGLRHRLISSLGRRPESAAVPLDAGLSHGVKH